MRGQISDCLDDLPTAQRAAFSFREVEGLTTSEICKILGVTSTNLGVMLYRARNRLRECLARPVVATTGLTSLAVPPGVARADET